MVKKLVVDGKKPIPEGPVDFFDARVIALGIGPDGAHADTGVVHQNVDAAEVVDAFCDPIVASFFIGYVSDNCDGAISPGLFADLTGNFAGGALVGVEDRRVKSIRRQGFRHGLSQASGAAGNESGFCGMSH
jgi:hypothetical protein